MQVTLKDITEMPEPLNAWAFEIGFGSPGEIPGPTEIKLITACHQVEIESKKNRDANTIEKFYIVKLVALVGMHETIMSALHKVNHLNLQCFNALGELVDVLFDTDVEFDNCSIIFSADDDIIPAFYVARFRSNNA